jgi:hypothetical protein
MGSRPRHQARTANPAVYEAGGRQFVVIVTSGGRARNAAHGASYVAYPLPR